MKDLKILGIAAIVAMAMAAFTATSASATTLEHNGVTQNKAVAIPAEVTAAGITLARTDGSAPNTCTRSELIGTTSVFTGTKVTGALSKLTFENCGLEGVEVHNAGQIYIEHEAGTTSGNVFSENAIWTVPLPIGFTVNCQTGSGTKLGTLTGVAAGNATITVNAVLNCGFLLPSGSFKGTYKVFTALGVSA